MKGAIYRADFTFLCFLFFLREESGSSMTTQWGNIPPTPPPPGSVGSEGVHELFLDSPLSLEPLPGIVARLPHQHLAFQPAGF